MFRVKKSIEMWKIKKMYSEKYMIPVTAIDFFFDGRKIQDDDTPKGLELEEGDAIEAGNAPFGFGLPGYAGGLGDDLHREMLNYVLDSWKIPFPDVNQLAMIPKMDSDGSQLLTCPYNSSHKIAKDRIQTHLVKCRRNHPEADLVVCPYNASHRVPMPEEQFHVTSCPDAHRRSFPEAKSDGRQEKKPNCIKKAFRAVKKVFCCI